MPDVNDDGILTDRPDKPLIGTYMERTLHSALKNYYEPDPEKQEKRFLGYVADIVNENGITEIQTRNFNSMRKKLDVFLAETKVTVVYPATRKKWLVWIDPVTGETTSKRRSPKVGTPYEVYGELYKIKFQLTHPNFHLRVVMVDVEEYRKARRGIDDPKRSGRYGSVRCERIPVDFADEICVDCPADYRRLMPEELPENFSSADFARCASMYRGRAQTALNVLTYVGAVERVSKDGNGYIYRVI